MNIQEIKFPHKLSELSGSSRGAVKILFDEKSGLDNFIQETPLIKRLKDWIDLYIKEPEKQPRIIFLVGGPGNGKTQAVNELIVYLKKIFRIDNLSKYTKSTQRCIEIDFDNPEKDLNTQLSDIHLKVVQDASVGEENSKNKTESLISELEQALDLGINNIYICCLNKGILDETLNCLNNRKENRIGNILKTILSASSIKADRISCWPLEGYENIGIWPMDIESLLEDQNNCIFDLTIKEIFTDENKWEFSEKKEEDPLFYNRQLMLNENSRNSLKKILRWYELASGQRWTFRDLFSLISYLFSGNITKSNIEKNNLHKKDEEKYNVKACFDKLGCTYAQRLFSFRITKEETTDFSKLWKRIIQKKECLKLKEKYSIFMTYLFEYLEKNTLFSAPSYISEQLTKLNKILSPLEYNKNSDGTWNDLYSNFSHSIQDGVEFAKKNNLYEKLFFAEKEILRVLMNLDLELGEQKHAIKQSDELQKMQFFIRRFACNLMRINDGATNATVKDEEIFEEYQKTIYLHWQGNLEDDVDNLEERLEQLLNDPTDHEKFSGTLNKTFGQVFPSELYKSSLISNKCTVSYHEDHEDEAYESSSGFTPKAYPFFDVDVGMNSFLHIPLTFDLYKAVLLLQKDLCTASLSRSVIARIDSCQALILGSFVRNQNHIKKGEVSLKIGNYKIRCKKLKFEIV